MQLRINPPLDRVIEYATGFTFTSEDQSVQSRTQCIIAERATREGRNFRFNRYVSSVTGEGTGRLKESVARLKELAGKTFPIVLDPRGRKVKGKLGELGADSLSIPNFVPRYPNTIRIGETIESDFVFMDDISATLREIRSLSPGYAAVFSLGGQAGERGRVSGTFVVSVQDGLPLAAEIIVNWPATDKSKSRQLRTTHRRLIVPGLDRLTADLKLGD
ncbi:MAG: hypothetical protein C4320_09830 [Armatimonadota bacterium]